MEDKLELHAIFRGQVQGIGFRVTVRHLASRSKLKGTVSNLPDGSVELYAQGSKEQLEQLIKQIQEEFGLSYINAIDLHYSAPSLVFESFNIIH